MRKSGVGESAVMSSGMEDMIDDGRSGLVFVGIGCRVGWGVHKES